MIATRWLWMPLVAALLLWPAQAWAFAVVLQYEGTADDRIAYFADVRVIANRTPPADVGGAHEIREIDVTAVYESADKPEFVHMKLQFQCPNAAPLDKAGARAGDRVPPVRAGDVVTFRIGPGSYQLRRADLETEPVAATGWNSSAAPALSRAGAIACNHIAFDHALHAAIKAGGTFDAGAFGKRMAALGLPADLPLLAETLPSEFLAFAWENFWWEKVLAGRRPDPSGKWATPLSEADRQAAMEKLKQKQRELETGTASIQAGLGRDIAQLQAQIQADTQAARGGGRGADGRTLTPLESSLLPLWKGRPEQDVVALMGNPQFHQAGDTRFLRYTQTWEREAVTAYGSQGVVGGDAGGFAMCFLEFRTRPDAQEQWQVDDILIRSDYEGAGLGRTRNMCEALARQAAGP